MISAGKIKPVLLQNRYRLSEFEDYEKSHQAELIDLEKKEFLEITEENGTVKVIGEKIPSINEEQARALLQEARAVVQKLLPNYNLKFYDDFVHASGSNGSRLFLDSPEQPSEPNMKVFHNFRLTHPKRRYEFVVNLEGTKMSLYRAEVFDKERGVGMSLRGKEFGRDFLDGAQTYLEPFLRIANIPPGGAMMFSSRWLSFVRSPEFDLLDGKTDGGETPSEDDLKIAASAYQAAISGYACYKAEDTCRDQGGVALLERYLFTSRSIPFESFLQREQSAASSLTHKLVSLWRTKMGEPPVLRLDPVGRFRYYDQGENKMLGELLNEKSNYLQEAFDALLLEQSHGQYKLRQPTLSYLDACLKLAGDELFFLDPEQGNGKALPLPWPSLHLILAGQSPIYHAGVNVDRFYFEDVNGDGRIQFPTDSVYQKVFGLKNKRVLRATLVENALDYLEGCGVPIDFPPPFDPTDFYTHGISLETLQAWGKKPNHWLLSNKNNKISLNPLADGEYRVFIFREGEQRFEDLFFWLSAFISLNCFDDVYVVPNEWGMELALNEVAAREIPLTQVYVGTHGYKRLELESILFDYNRRLVFKEGAQAVYTGCHTRESVAHASGAQLFKHSNGSLIWSDDVNIPLPFGNIFSLAPDGHFYETYFDHGKVVKTVTRYLVDPVPGGLF